MTKLTDQQREILERGAEGICINYQTTWVMGGKPVTRTVKALIKRGLGDALYFSGGRAAFNATDAGRMAIKQ